MRPVAVDVFSGAGGMSLGFEAAGFDVVAAIDSDPVHLATYSYNFPFAELVARSVVGLRGSEILEAVAQGLFGHQREGQWDGVLDCLFGGPSCQSFSAIGRGDPKDPRSRLVEHFARLVVELRPRTFVMENVPGILHRKHQPLLRRLVQRIRRAGYIVTGDGPVVLDAADFGVPQRRQRVFLLGSLRGEIDRIRPPFSKDISTTVGHAINDLVDADIFPELLETDEVVIPIDLLNKMEADASEYVRQLRRPESGAFGRNRRWDRSVLTSSLRTSHSLAVTKRFKALAPGERDAVSRMPRLKGNMPAPTLRAGTGRDRGSFTACRPIHHKHQRVITVREAARLHGFPDWFRFHRTKWHGFRQVGNAVPPPLAESVATQTLRALGCKPERIGEEVPLGDPASLRLSLVQAAAHLGIDFDALPPYLPGGARNGRRQDHD